ncbi:ABC transporter permease [Faunimonas sp. B44]|uniref:ABC transporter permease n=1 Tax=Faunimonas sp. B44 TaxID=3461493 RepID=UPI0040444AC9
MDWTIPRLPVAAFFDAALDLLTQQFSGVTRAMSAVLATGINASTGFLTGMPPWLVILVTVVLIWRLSTLRIAIFSAATLLLLWNVGLWRATVQSLVLVMFSTLVALAIGIPIGILAAVSTRFWRVTRPILDMMQTLPSFVYLIPAIPFFGLGAVSACFATIVFSMPPVIRLTALGLLQTPPHLIEAADAFGSTRWQKLVKVQMPLAVPTMMAGINQTIMLALSMVVIAAMIGAGGLGGEVWRAIQRLDAGAGFQAGFAIVLVAVILDRITHHISDRLQARTTGTG